MKKLTALAVLILLMIAYAGHSQTDTVCLPVKDAKNKLVQIERLKADSAELILVKEESKQLREFSISQNKTIEDLRRLSVTQDLLVGNFKLQLDNKTMQSEMWHDLYRKQKKKTNGIIIGGVLVVSGLTYFLITK